MLRNLEISTAYAASDEFPRASEGSVIELLNGDLFMIFQRFEKSPLGSDDFAPDRLVSIRSSDGGRTWDRPRIEAEPDPGDVNVYSPCLIRLRNGSILFSYKHYVQAGPGLQPRCTAVAYSSYDEGETFTDKRIIWQEQEYGFASSTMRMLSGSRLILPVEKIAQGTTFSKDENWISGCAVSDDMGQTWSICPGWVRLPMRGVMEGHVEELKDGRILKVMRTQLGAVFKAYSEDRGETWSKPQTTGMRAPESCPDLSRTPDGDRLILIWNNSEYDPGFTSHYGKRTPLSVAFSTDEGETFQYAGDIETDPGWAYSNPGTVFLRNGKCLVNYWAVKYTPSGWMSGLLHLKTASFEV